MKERDNHEWITDLKSTGARQAAALEELRRIISRSLAHALTRYLKPDDPRFETLVEEATQDSLLKVLHNLDSFAGRSKFTTWVYKIAIRVALTELRRKRWQNVSLDEMIENYENESLFSANQVDSEEKAHQDDLIQQVSEIINNHLTVKQRTALIALGGGMPLEEVAHRMGTNRNALYKLLHDARKNLKSQLSAEGLSVDEILTAFEE